ncbi:MAG: DUF4003 family protein, partial [Lysinibacillus sp.]
LRLPTPLGSVLHGYGNDPILLDKIAAKFIIEGHVDESIAQLHKQIQVLKDAGFSSGYNLYYAALFLQDAAHAKRAKLFFDEMKRNQRILTRKSDYPIAVLLTKRGGDPKQLADTIYKYYEALKQHDFKAGDQLQMLAQYLAFYSEHYVAELVDYAVQLKKQIAAKALRVTRNIYPFIGLLALNATTEAKLQEILQTMQQILQQKDFKNMQRLAFSAAVLKSLTERTTEETLAFEQQIDWLDIMFYSDIFLVLPKMLIESIVSLDFNIFQ